MLLMQANSFYHNDENQELSSKHFRCIKKKLIYSIFNYVESVNNISFLKYFLFQGIEMEYYLNITGKA